MIRWLKRTSRYDLLHCLPRWFSLFLAGMSPCFLPISSLLQGDLTICAPRPCHSVTESCSPPSISSHPQCSWRCSSARTPDTRHSPSSSASGVSGDWLPELAKKKGQSSLLPAFCSLAPLQSLPMSQARVQRPRAPGAGPWVPARRRCVYAGAHSVVSLVH